MDTLRFYIRSLALPLGELSSKVTERAVTVGDRERQGNKFRLPGFYGFRYRACGDWRDSRIGSLLHGEGIDIQILVRIHPLPAVSGFLDAAAMLGKQPHNVIHIDPDFGISRLLALVKYQLHAKMQMHGFDIVHVFPV